MTDSTNPALDALLAACRELVEAEAAESEALREEREASALYFQCRNPLDRVPLHLEKDATAIKWRESQQVTKIARDRVLALARRLSNTESKTRG